MSMAACWDGASMWMWIERGWAHGVFCSKRLVPDSDGWRVHTCTAWWLLWGLLLQLHLLACVPSSVSPSQPSHHTTLSSALSYFSPNNLSITRVLEKSIQPQESFNLSKRSYFKNVSDLLPDILSVSWQTGGITVFAPQDAGMDATPSRINKTDTSKAGI